MKSQQIIAKSCIVFVCMNYPNWNENDYSCFPLSCWRARRAVGRSDGTIFVNWAHKSVYSLGTSVTDGCSGGVWKEPHILAVIWPPSGSEESHIMYPMNKLHRTTRAQA